jgi:multidrug efflux pump subunit AcrA (membrane-fusion protein)
VGILLTFGATRIFAPQTTANGTSESTEAIESAANSQTVTVAEVTTTDINNRLNASGTVIAYERIPVMSQAAGLQITDVLVERGDYVDRDRVLARLNNQVLSAEKFEARGAVAQAKARLSELQAGSRSEEIARAESRVANARSAVTQTESDLELVQKRVERNQTLQAEGAISRDRLDEILNQERVAKSALTGAKANFNEARQELAQLRAGSRPETIAQARAELTQAQGRLQAIEAQLAETTITAPTAGIIADREAKVGQITSNSEMLFTIIQDGRLELRLQIPETLIGKIQPGQSVLVTSNNRNIKLTGKVRQIDPAIDDSSRQATVRVDLPQGTNLKPGMFLQAAINTDTNQGQAVSIEALLPQSGNKAIAFVVQADNTVKAQKVTMGEILSEQQVEVVEGLQPGDRIVLKGAAYLKDGDRVVISQ